MNEETRIARHYSAESALAVRARDSRLVSLTLSGDQEAFEELVRLYYDRLRSLVYHHLHSEDELDDALQDILLKAYQALHGFRRHSNFYTWLFRIASNYCIDRLRKRRPELVSIEGAESPDGLQARLPSRGDSPDESFARGQRVDQVRRALKTLDPIYQNVIVLRELEGLSYEELVESLNLNIGTVKSRLARARSELKKRLEEMGAV